MSLSLKKLKKSCREKQLGLKSETTEWQEFMDLADVARNLASRQPRHRHGVPPVSQALRIRPLAEVTSHYYVRLMVLDKPGSLGIFTSILGKHGVSISAVTQRAVLQEGGHVPVVVLTHAAREAKLDAALVEIQAAGVVGEKPTKLRMLD